MKKIIAFDQFLKEMSLSDLHAVRILNHMQKADSEELERCYFVITGKKHATENEVLKEIKDMSYEDIQEIEKEILATSPEELKK